MSATYFKRPCWLTLFFSVGLLPVSFIGFKLTPFVSERLLHHHAAMLDFESLIMMGFGLLAWIGILGIGISSLWCMIDALVLYVRSKPAKHV
jgi:hypothetical protein